MMGMENWQGAWIGDNRDINYKPAPISEKHSTLKRKSNPPERTSPSPVLYELYINGEKIGNHRLDPLYTRFDRRNFYVTYDVTNQLQKGKNAIGVLLGNGWVQPSVKSSLGL